MLDQKTIKNLLKARLGENLEGLPQSVSWPNQDHDGEAPYLEVIFAGGRRSGAGKGTLDGSRVAERNAGTMLINVVVEANVSEGPADEYAEIVAGLFYDGLILTGTGVAVTITKPSDIRAGIPIPGGWQVPVLVTYVGNAT